MNPAAPWSIPQSGEHPALDASQYPTLDLTATPFISPEADDSTLPPDSTPDDREHGPGPGTADVSTLPPDSTPDDSENGPGTADDNGQSRDDSAETTVPEKIVKVLSCDRIFINEDLTRTRDYMLYVARHAKKMLRIEDCWAYNGTIRIKKLDNAIFAAKTLSDIPDCNAVLSDLRK